MKFQRSQSDLICVVWALPSHLVKSHFPSVFVPKSHFFRRLGSSLLALVHRVLDEGRRCFLSYSFILATLISHHPSVKAFFFKLKNFFDMNHFLKRLYWIVTVLLRSYVLLFFFSHQTCGILIARPGIEPTPPALQGEILMTGPPGKSLLSVKAFCLKATATIRDMKHHKKGHIALQTLNFPGKKLITLSVSSYIFCFFLPECYCESQVWPDHFLV